ncbi:MAG: single-stranded DNA-binding protein [Acidovorax sp.]|jgi:single-stranded DNA-binding protein|uniref:single-stranded DNA-binding protein n=1 Tax=Acidovorax sp. TaxID=1872122 RepID=UPI0025B8CA48|nr:single-stranded DNA-binding protein [Acidovorax sp.]MCO4093302.1 single-stranded DNA-binding protein [Acidovorax sp.]MDH4463130.1 single-stranded DNA-binding protein [Acidovorax sp.]
MIDGIVAGRLHTDAEQRVDKFGKAFTVVKMKAGTGEGEAVLVNVIAFDHACQGALRLLREGDAVALAGALTPRVWTDKQGNARPALDMVAHRAIVAEGSTEAGTAGD